MPQDPLRRYRDLRARPGLGVSIPVPWDALPVLRGRDPWTLATAREHLPFEREDAWAAFRTSRRRCAAWA